MVRQAHRHMLKRASVKLACCPWQTSQQQLSMPWHGTQTVGERSSRDPFMRTADPSKGRECASTSCASCSAAIGSHRRCLPLCALCVVGCLFVISAPDDLDSVGAGDGGAAGFYIAALPRPDYLYYHRAWAPAGGRRRRTRTSLGFQVQTGGPKYTDTRAMGIVQKATSMRPHTGMTG